MNRSIEDRIEKWIFYLALTLIVYMPLHVFIVQSASLLTGGLEVWKAAKDVLLFIASPALLYFSYKRGLFQDKTFRYIAVLGTLYAVIHGLFLVFDQNDDTYSALVGSVYNTRILLYLLLGYVVGVSKNGKLYLKYLLTATVIVASLVALFGVLQYFLPHDLLTNVGYTLERGVKPLFFIDDKPDLPRVMSTLKDPNSLGAYLILPILFTGFSLVSKSASKEFFAREFRKGTLAIMLALQLLALFFTFSRGALLALLLSTVTTLSIVTGRRVWGSVRKYAWPFIIFVALVFSTIVLFRNTYIFQNYVFHADESTVLADPNELRVSLTQDALEDVVEAPIGHGPGSAGLVSINNPQGGILTENYYLQIGYEVGWLGLILFLGILLLIVRELYSKLRQIRNLEYKNHTNSTNVAQVVLASLAGYLFYSLLIHLWSNEAIALQWWLLFGVAIGSTMMYNNIDYK